MDDCITALISSDDTRKRVLGYSLTTESLAASFAERLVVLLAACV